MKKPNAPELHYPCRQATRVTQVFGVNRGSYARFGLLGHDGIDFGLPVGNDLYSVADGTVTLIQTKTTGYGRLVVIQHNGYRSYYGHNSEFRVQLGEQVTAGQVVGLSGGATTDRYSGNSSGPHLHFEIRPDGVSSSNGYGGAVDPFVYLLERYFLPPEAIGTVTPWAGLNVRNKPSIFASTVLQKLRKDTPVEVWEVVDGWAKLRSLRNEYVSSAYLDLSEIEFQERKDEDVIPFDCQTAISLAEERGRATAISEMASFLKNL